MHNLAITLRSHAMCKNAMMAITGGMFVQPVMNHNMGMLTRITAPDHITKNATQHMLTGTTTIMKTVGMAITDMMTLEGTIKTKSKKLHGR